MAPDVRLESKQIEEVLRTDVLKREVLEGDKADAATRQVARAAGRTLRKAKAKAREASDSDPGKGEP
jgi:hypothetical protein